MCLNQGQLNNMLSGGSLGQATAVIIAIVFG